MIQGVVGTTVIIHLFRKRQAATSWLRAQNSLLAITSFTWLEVMAGATSKANQTACKALLATFEMEQPTTTDINWAMEHLERYRLSAGVGVFDCLIASVCYRLQVPLYTHNLRHMSVLLNAALVKKPYE